MPLSKWFSEFFHPKKGDEVIPWDDEEGLSVGFSVLRDYPENGSFLPSRTRANAQDSVALLKLGYITTQVDTKRQRAPLLVSATKASRYMLKERGRFRYDFDNPDAPTEASLAASEASQQPVNLVDDGRFVFLITEQKFWDDRKQKDLTLNELVEHIYNLHIDTTSSSLAAHQLRFKLWLQDRTGKVLMRLVEWFEHTADSFFEKTVNRNARGARFGVGLFEPYTHNDFDPGYPKPIKIEDTPPKSSSLTSVPGTDLKISTPAAIIASIFLLGIFYFKYRYNYDLWGMYGFMSAYKDQTIFTIVLVIGVFVASNILWNVVSLPFKRLRKKGVADFVFEFIFLPAWNLAITTRWAVLNKKFRYELSSKWLRNSLSRIHSWFATIAKWIKVLV